MGFLGKLIGSAVDIVSTPIKIITDITGVTENATVKKVDSAVEKLGESIDDLSEGEL